MKYYQIACYDASDNYRAYSGGYRSRNAASWAMLDLAYQYPDCTTIMYTDEWKEIDGIRAGELSSGDELDF